MCCVCVFGRQERLRSVVIALMTELGVGWEREKPSRRYFGSKPICCVHFARLGILCCFQRTVGVGWECGSKTGEGVSAEEGRKLISLVGAGRKKSADREWFAIGTSDQHLVLNIIHTYFRTVSQRAGLG